MNEQDVAKVYETLLCSPGMNEPVKLDSKLSRKTILFLTQLIEQGLANVKSKTTSGLADQQSIDELNELSQSSLEKAGLTQLSHKLRDIHT